MRSPGRPPLPLPVHLIGHRFGSRRVVRVYRAPVPSDPRTQRYPVLWACLLCDCGRVDDAPLSGLLSHSRGGRHGGDVGCRACAKIASCGTLTEGEARRRLEELDSAAAP